MTMNIQAVTVIATKMASGTVQLLFQNPSGGIRFISVIPAADFTSFNTTVNGGATGATLTRTYTQDQFPVDYPLEAVLEV
jgi:hypothetical protein